MLLVSTHHDSLVKYAQYYVCLVSCKVPDLQKFRVFQVLQVEAAIQRSF